MSDMALLLHYGPSLLEGAGVTLLCWAAGTVLALALGLLIAAGRELPIPPLRWLLRGLVEIVRGVPFLVQLYLLYDGGPALGLRLSAVASGIIALGVYGSAYYAEIFRAGFAAVPAGQIEAAVATGMTASQIMRRVRLPAMAVAIAPPLVNMTIILSKETVVLSIITVPELMYQAQTMASETFASFETILALAVLYWAMVEGFSRLGRAGERRMTAYLA